MSFCRFAMISLMVGLLAGCLDQYNPYPHWQQIAKEHEIAHRDLPKLNDDGTLPEKKAAEENVASASESPIEEKFNSLCATCHGVDGKANTPAANALSPKPRDFTNVAWQDSVSDERIETVILKGGAAVGLSPSMAPWEAMLPGDLGKQMVEKVRSFKGK